MGSRLVIVIAGCMHAGKDSLADRIAEALPDSRRDAFAAPLKQCVHLKTGIPMDILLGPPALKNDIKYGRYGKTPRLLMQEEGQEARERLGATIWADRLVERAHKAPERCTIVSDGRHPAEEVTGIRDALGGEGTVLAVRVVRPSEPVRRGHPSEDKIADAPDDLFDVKVVNDGTLDDLAAAAQQVADLAVLRDKTGKKRPEGWIVACPVDDGRLTEPLATAEDGHALASQLCPVCYLQDGHEVRPVTYDRIQIM